MPNPIVITVDSPADFSTELAERFDVVVIPLIVNLKEKSYFDGVDISPKDIFKAYNEDRVLPKTSSVPIPSYIDVFSSLTQKGMDVVHISLSSKISSTNQNAAIAASEFENVYVVDSLSLCSGMALLAIKACKMRDKGMPAQEIVKKLCEIREKICVSFIIDKLEFLCKGGRCSALANFGANILGIKPRIEMKDGSLDVSKKYRGKIEQARLQYLEDEIREADGDIDLECAFLVHTGVDESELLSAKEYIKNRVNFKEIFTVQAGCVITTHCGQNCFAFMYMKK
ncbi:MAG TPA: DegV family protein [Clostridia bacterium]|nr:DegV family protein [Clostridia bacterium]